MVEQINYPYVKISVYVDSKKFDGTIEVYRSTGNSG
jgi:tagatose-1,6-bisphosphate aldolase